MRINPVAGALGIALAGLAGTASLARGLPPRPETIDVAPGVRPGPDAFQPVVGRRDAERLANAAGLAEVDDADLDRGVWTVTGTDVSDRDMTVIVDARSGRILQARYD